MTSPLGEGLHEALLTRELQEALSRETTLLPDLGKVDPEDQVYVLARHLASAAFRRLEAVRDPARRFQLANDLLAHITDDSQLVIDPVELLLGLRRPNEPGTVLRYTERPRTPLNDAALLTNAHGEPSLAAELKAEIDSADRSICSARSSCGAAFDCSRRSSATRTAAGVPSACDHTTYIGGTEREALDRLVRDFGAEVKVQYDAARTRLHAKAWIFRRQHGFRHGVRRFFEPLHKRAARGSRVERPAVATARRRRSAEVPRRRSTPTGIPASSSPTTLTEIAIDSMKHWPQARGGGAETESRSRFRVSKCAPFPYQQEMLDTLGGRSGSCTIATATSSWPPPARARR